MAVNLQQWRQRNHLTQVETAALLGVSQPYLSLLEQGARPLTAEVRSRLATVRRGPAPRDNGFREKLSALRYPGFAHVRPTRTKPSVDAFLLSALSQRNADARVAEALPWVVGRDANQLNLPWLVRQAKLQNLQNRLGFLLQLAAADSPELSDAVAELERARLLQEDTFCWESMPAATREWMREHRHPLAEHWNIVTTLATEASSRAE